MTSTYASFIEQRQQFIADTHDPALQKHFQAEIGLVNSWTKSPCGGSQPPPICAAQNGPPLAKKAACDPATQGDRSGPPPQSGTAPLDSKAVPHGYGDDWRTIRYSNTTTEPITMNVVVKKGQPLPKGVDAKGNVTISPGQSVDLTFAPETSANFRSTKGDGSVWNQGEVYFDESKQLIWGNMSYIYGANSNMRMFSKDGQHSGYLGNLFANAPPAAKVGQWGLMAPYDRFHSSDDPSQPGSATGGPGGAKNAGADYLYSILKKGEGYVERGRPAEVTDYDDASSLRFTGSLAVVF